jgi:hypothetical protein
MTGMICSVMRIVGWVGERAINVGTSNRRREVAI